MGVGGDAVAPGSDIRRTTHALPPATYYLLPTTCSRLPGDHPRRRIGEWCSALLWRPGEPCRMHARDYALFPTRLLTLQFDDTDELNQDIYKLFTTQQEFREQFDMHPDALNLLRLAGTNASIARLRGLFLDGLGRWLGAEGLQGEHTGEMVL